MIKNGLIILQSNEGFFNILVEKFNEGNDGGFMWPVILCLVAGLAICIERLITLNLADINRTKFINKIKYALQTEGFQAAEDICANTRGPVAAVFQAGLTRAEEGIEAAEKAIQSYGSIEMSWLERGLVWLSLFIQLAPLFGFLGTVIGMIQAFDAIEAAGDISPSLVAGGIKVALLTTAGGLLAGIILQMGYNYCVSKIDRIVTELEVSSLTLIDAIVLMKEGKPLIDLNELEGTSNEQNS